MTEAYLELRKRSVQTVEVLEVFGGEGGVTKVAIRSGLAAGGNFDIVAG